MVMADEINCYVQTSRDLVCSDSARLKNKHDELCIECNGKFLWHEGECFCASKDIKEQLESKPFFKVKNTGSYKITDAPGDKEVGR